MTPATDPRLLEWIARCDEALSRGETPPAFDGDAPPDVLALLVELRGPRQSPETVPNAARPAGTTDAPPGYEILGPLGVGGMGVVRKARQLSLGGRVVALKTIRAGASAGPEEVERFLREAEAAARLHHPHIAQVYESGVSADGSPYFVMEFCPGGTLAELLRGEPLAPNAAASLVASVADAMAHAHAAGVVHRDLKTANVLLDAAGVPKVADFGLAKLTGAATMTADQRAMGTPAYMAPEQCLDAARVDGRADIWAMGVILYECLTGSRPFAAPTPFETMNLVRTRDPVPPRQLRPGLPRDLETVCLKCLRKEPSERYQSADDLSDDLRRFLEGRPVVARPVGAIGRGWRWAKRHRALAALYVVSMLGGAALVGLALWFTVELAAQSALTSKANRDRAAIALSAEEKSFDAHLSKSQVLLLERKAGFARELVGEVRAAMGYERLRGGRLGELRQFAVRGLTDFDAAPLPDPAPGFLAFRSAFDPTGRWLALGQSPVKSIIHTGEVRLVPLAGGEARSLKFRPAPARRPNGEPSLDGVRSLAFSPDGHLVVAGMRSGNVLVWDLRSDEKFPLVVPTGPSGINAVRFLPDGSGLLAFDAAGVRRFAVGEWAARPEDFRAANAVRGWALHPSGHHVSLNVIPEGGDRAEIVALNTRTLRPLGPRVRAGRAEHWAYSSDGTNHWRVASNTGVLRSSRQSFNEQDSIGGGLRGASPEAGCIADLAVHPDDLMIAVASEGSSLVQLHDPAGRSQVRAFTVPTPSELNFSPDGAKLAVAGVKGQHLFSINGGRYQSHISSGEKLGSFAIAADGRSVTAHAGGISVSPKTLLRTWSLPEDGGRPAIVGEYVAHQMYWDLLAAVSPTRRIAAIHDGDNTLRFVPLGPATEFPPPRTPRQPEGFEAFAFAPDGSFWYAVLHDIFRCDIEGDRTTKCLRKKPSQELPLQNKSIGCFTFGRTFLMLGTADGVLEILDTSDGRSLSRVKLADLPIRSGAAGPGPFVAAGDGWGTVHVVEAATGRRVASVAGEGQAITALAWSAGDVVATGTAEGTIRLYRWDGTSLRPLFELPAGHGVRQLAFHPDGVRLFALHDTEQAIRVWHLDRLRADLESLGLGADLDGIRLCELPKYELLPDPPTTVERVPADEPGGLRVRFYRRAEKSNADFLDGKPYRLFRESVEGPFAFDQPADPAIFPAGSESRVEASGWIVAPRAGRYLVELGGLDTRRLWIDGKPYIDTKMWGAVPRPDAITEIPLTGRPQEIRIEVVQNTATPPNVRLSWSLPGDGGFGWQLVPRECLAVTPDRKP